jgi:hypothetical protein
MNQDPRETLKTILEIIGYEGDKEQFATQFLELVFKQAFTDYYMTLPDDKKKELDDKFGTDEKVNMAQLSQLTQDNAEFTKAVQKSAESMLVGYIEEILPALDGAQKDKLQDYLASLANTQG